MIDFTKNHGADRRIYSPILGRPTRSLRLSTPRLRPVACLPIDVFLHGADIDEHDFMDPGDLKKLDY